LSEQLNGFTPLPLHSLHEAFEERLTRDDWKEAMLELTAEEHAQELDEVAAFAAEQSAVCQRMDLSRDQWLYLATRLQRRWELEEQQQRLGINQVDGDDIDDDVA